MPSPETEKRPYSLAFRSGTLSEGSSAGRNQVLSISPVMPLGSFCLCILREQATKIPLNSSRSVFAPQPRANYLHSIGCPRPRRPTSDEESKTFQRRSPDHNAENVPLTQPVRYLQRTSLSTWVPTRTPTAGFTAHVTASDVDAWLGSGDLASTNTRPLARPEFCFAKSED